MISIKDKDGNVVKVAGIGPRGIPGKDAEFPTGEAGQFLGYETDGNTVVPVDPPESISTFIATPNVTTYAEAMEAYNAGKAMYCYDTANDRVGVLYRASDAEICWVTAYYQYLQRYDLQPDDTWNVYEVPLEPNFSNISFLGENITGGTDNDTTEFWANKESGRAWFSADDMLIDQPHTYCLLINNTYAADVFQILRVQPAGPTYFRSGNTDGWSGTWTKVYDDSNRLSGSTVGENSVALGVDVEATGIGSVAIGYKNGAHAKGATTLGYHTEAYGEYGHAEGYYTKAQGTAGHAEGYETTVTGGGGAHAEGYNTIAKGHGSHAEGDNTIAGSALQHVQGKYNIEDSDDVYAHIIGGGTSDDDRKNIHTIDWEGNAEFVGQLTAEWLQTKADTHRSDPAEKIAVLDGSGWIYHRTPAEALSDMGGIGKFDDNITGGSENDTVDFWVEKGAGYGWISDLNQIVGQPAQFGFIINYTNGGDVFQIFRDQTDGVTYYRSGDDINGWFQSWREVVTKDSNGAINTNGLYATHVEVSDGNTKMGLYSNGLGADGDAVWIDQAGDAYFTEVNIGTKGNYKKAATQEYVDNAIGAAIGGSY